MKYNISYCNMRFTMKIVIDNIALEPPALYFVYFERF